MRLGLLPALGGGIRELAQSGQVARLIDGYFRRYVEAFDEITYFSYLDESIDEYTQDATIRMRYLVNALGMFDVHVATYYYNRGAYLAAINRAQSAIVNYPQTASNEDALILMVKSYEKLDMKQLAEDSRQVLAKTFPQSTFLSAAPKPWWKIW